MATTATLAVYGVMVVFLAAGVRAQLGSVHCKVGCACSEELRPVCGNDLATYKNECKLRCRQCEVFGLAILYEGPCFLPPPSPYVQTVVPAAPQAAVPAPVPVPAVVPAPAPASVPAPAPAPAVVPAPAPAAYPVPATLPADFSPPVIYRPPFYPYPVNYVYGK